MLGLTLAKSLKGDTMEQIGISGAWLHEVKVFQDIRGSFHEWFHAKNMREATGRDFNLRQANCLVSKKGVLRGIHYASVPPGQAKYATCVRGEVLGGVLDVRTGSPTFGAWRTVELNSRDYSALYIAEGLGFGFVALSDDAVLLYLSSQEYDRRREHGVNPLDPEVGIGWPAGISFELSERDASAPGLAEAGRRGLLPRYADCRRYSPEGSLD
jgi:dTDP-4-dehydrorhamnose 3,5-epimerase